MTVSQEFLDLTLKKESLPADPNAGYSVTERWRMSGDTFPARFVNSIGRLVYRRFTLDSEAQPCDDYYKEQPRTVTQRLRRIKAALNPNLLLLQLGNVANDIETSAVDAI